MSKKKEYLGALPSDEELRKIQEDSINARKEDILNGFKKKLDAIDKKTRDMPLPKPHTFLTSKNVTTRNIEVLKDLISKLKIGDIKELVELLEHKDIEADKNSLPTLKDNIQFIKLVSRDEYFILLSKLYLFFLDNINKAPELHEAILDHNACEEQQKIYTKHWEQLRHLLSCLLNYRQIENDRFKYRNKTTDKAETTTRAKKTIENIIERTLKDIKPLKKAFENNPSFQRAVLEANLILGIEKKPLLNPYPLLEDYHLFLLTIKNILSKENSREASNEKPLARASLYVVQRIYNNITQTDQEYTTYNDYLNTKPDSDNVPVELNKMISHFYLEDWVPISIAPSMFKRLKSKSKTKSGK